MHLGRGTIAAGIVAALGSATWAVLAIDSSGPDELPGVLPPVAARPVPSQARVTALGRLEPKDGLIRLAGPSDPAVVIAELFVDEGDRVVAGQILARLDTFAIRQAMLERAKAELANTRSERKRNLEMHRDRVISDSLRDQWELQVKMAQAEVDRASAELAHAQVRSSVDGVVIGIQSREGERVGEEGILEIGRIDAMYAIAEVYETDIPGVYIGQRATVTSPALPSPLTGEVEWIRLKVGKMDVLGADPAAKTDARIIEVEIRLDESGPASGLTNLQVEVEFEP